MKRGIEIGDYVLAELLSTGGMGQVWLGRREFEGGGKKSVAIKFPHASGVLDVRIRESLLDEARLQMQLQHSNIPRAIDMGIHEGLPYFVMDYIAGRSLAQLLTRLREVGTPLRFELVAHIAREIAYALRYAHGFEKAGVRQQIIHRDVAPKNVLLSGHGGVYVIDFGVSEALGVHSSRNHIKGTLLYMAPEHALGFPSPKSDAWGLGAILWEMIEGRQFRGDIEPGALRRAANEGRHGPLNRPNIPDPLRFVTEGLLRVDERERLTLDEIVAPLEASEFPPQRSALSDLMRRRFGGSVSRSGQTLHDFQMPEQLDRAIAAARVVKDGGLTMEACEWSTEAFEAAGARQWYPRRGHDRSSRARLGDDDDESKPRVQASLQTSGDPRATDGPPTSTLRTTPAGETERFERSPRSSTEVLPPVQGAPGPVVDELIRTERVPHPPVASAAVSTAPSEPRRDPDAPILFRRRSNRETTQRAPEVAVEPPARPSAAGPGPSEETTEVRAPSSAETAAPVAAVSSRSVSTPIVGRSGGGSAPYSVSKTPSLGHWFLVGAVMLAGVVWLATSWSTRSPPPASPKPTSESALAVGAPSSAQPGRAVEGPPPRATEPPPESERTPEPKPRPEPEPEPPVVAPTQVPPIPDPKPAPSPSFVEPTPAPLVPEPESEPAIAEPAPAVEPETGGISPEPSPEAEDVSGHSPPPTSASTRDEEPRRPARVRVSVVLGRADAMEFEIDGKRRSLTTRGERTIVRVKAGDVLVRWREPGAEWSSRTIDLERKRDYVVHVHPWGPLVVTQ